MTKKITMYETSFGEIFKTDKEAELAEIKNNFIKDLKIYFPAHETDLTFTIDNIWNLRQEFWYILSECVRIEKLIESEI